MKTKHKQPLRGSAATFTALLPENRRLTLPEFSYAQTIPFKKQTDVLALTLIRLWTLEKLGGHQTPIGKNSSSGSKADVLHQDSNPWQTSAFYHISPETIHQHFVGGQPKNLGALTLLNLLLSNRDTPRSLGVTTNTKTAEFFFTPLSSSFWSDYFYPPYHHYFLTTQGPLEYYLARGLSLDKHTAWWKTALQGQNDTEQRVVHLEELFQFEIFETALRILLTPNAVIERLVQLTIQQTDLNFNQYLFKTINQFKKIFFDILSENQKEQWTSWVAGHGLFYFKSYMNYLSQLRVDFNPKLTPNLPVKIVENLVLKGMKLNIPHLHCAISLDQIRGFTVNSKAQLFDYLIEQFEDNWGKIAAQPYAELWVFTHQLLSNLEEEFALCSIALNIDNGVKPFLCHFMMTCMSLGKYSFIKFLLSQDDTLVHLPIKKSATLLPDDEKWANHSLLYFAQQKKDDTMIALLQSKGARLLTKEMSQNENNSPISKKSNHRRRLSFWDINEISEMATEKTSDLNPLR